MERGGCVYILTNKSNNVLYTGVTSNLQSRMFEHINKVFLNSFTAKYNCYKLVYYKQFSSIDEAIQNEKYIKGKKREYKINLITDNNPNWNNLYETEVKFW
ncbi:MAG: GIY-YIG nuclease family protein [Chitinophagales bacterium]|nr:GIY-YIG nuclease family protein [Chitinophagales bacterium]